MFDQIAVALMLIGALTGASVVTITVIGATWYDLRAARCKRQSQLHPYAHQNRQRPVVTVMIPAKNNDRTIKRCLNNVFACSYKKLEVIVVDYASRDETRQLVKRYAAEHPKKSIILSASRRSDVTVGSLAASCRHHANGRLVMVLEPDCLVDGQMIRSAVQHMNADQRMAMLKPARIIATSLSVLGLFQQYQSFFKRRTEKLASVAGFAAASDGVASAMYRYDVFVALAKPTGQSDMLRQLSAGAYYASDSIVRVPAQASLKIFARTIRRRRPAWGCSNTRRLFNMLYAVCAIIFSVTIPILLGYFIYLAFDLHEPTLLLLSGAIFGVLLVFAIWEDEHISPEQKVVFTVGMPAMCGLFLVSSVIRPLLFFAAERK